MFDIFLRGAKGAEPPLKINVPMDSKTRVRRLFTKFQVDTCKIKKRYICACAVAHLVVEIQGMIYNVARVRRLPTKFQVDTCKSKEDTSAHVQLRTL